MSKFIFWMYKYRNNQPRSQGLLVVDIECILLSFLSENTVSTKWRISKGILARPNLLWQEILRGQELVAWRANPIWRISKGILARPNLLWQEILRCEELVACTGCMRSKSNMADFEGHAQQKVETWFVIEYAFYIYHFYHNYPLTRLCGTSLQSVCVIIIQVVHTSYILAGRFRTTNLTFQCI